MAPGHRGGLEAAGSKARKESKERNKSLRELRRKQGERQESGGASRPRNCDTCAADTCRCKVICLEGEAGRGARARSLD
jgi:hypothetical protein